MLLSGDNNVYTSQWNGRQVRSRNWDILYGRPYNNKIEILNEINKLKNDFKDGSIKCNRWKTYESFYNKIFKIVPENNIGMFAHRFYLYRSCYEANDKYQSIREDFEKYINTMGYNLLLKEEMDSIKTKILEMFPIIDEKDLFSDVLTISPELKGVEK
jgi:hypothetical protein